MANTKIPVELSSTPGIVDNSNATAITIDSSENVGIGTSSPSSSLHIDTTGASALRIERNSGTDANCSIEFNCATTDYYVGTNPSNNFAIGTSVDQTNSNFQITSSGNVGIGGTPTNYSDHKTLSLYGNTGTGAGFIEFNDTSGNADAVIFSDDGNLFINADYDNTAASSSIRFRVDGSSEKMRIDSSGNVGIGGTSPGSYGKFVLFQNSNTNGGGISVIDSGLARTGRLWTDGNRVYLNSGATGTGDLVLNEGGGRVMLGTSSNSGVSNNADNLIVGDNTSATEQGITLCSALASGIRWNDGADAGLIEYIHSSNTMTFYTSGSERMRINSTGDVLIGTTNTDPTFNRSDGICLSAQDAIFCRGGAAWDLGRNSTSGTHIAFYTDNGSARVSAGNISSSGSTTSFNTTSDGRLKDITGEARGLEVINELNPVSYNWKADGKADEGFIAQEVQEIVPNAVSQNEENEMYQMDYSKLVVHLVKGMKEQQAQIEALQSEINELKNS